MNRFVSLLLAALCLAAVTLAQPAHAQWVASKAYFGSSNSGSSTPGTTVTATINNNSTGHLNITATPTSSTGSTSGSYSGNVSVDYTWTGSNPNGTSITMTQVLESTGAAGGPGGYGTSGNSNAGGQAAYGDFSMYPTGWDQKPTQGSITNIYTSGVIPPKITRTFGLGGSVSAQYYNNPGPSIVTADVTFSFTHQ